MTLRSWIKRAIPEPMEPLVRRVLRRYRLVRGPYRGRDGALRAEVAFWKQWLTRGGAKVEERLASVLTDKAIIECVSRIPKKHLDILDVGAGLLTTIGTELPGKRIVITATDPLADDYDRILSEAGITPPVKTIRCAGEDLVERFGSERFDIAFSENALDHTSNPLAILRNMVAVVKPRGFVVLNHFRNEGEHSSYGHLHQWNFDERDGHCLLWRDREFHDVGQVLLGMATIECRREYRSRETKQRVVCIITKTDEPT